ncbi:UBX domain-containing protein 6 [Galendromus occidentalis]|uniref:UBX domain-containing protein 6 n=1 Tax=Galendromus occidentalis TaxID=34638 RepID=A0AAJ6QX76_9ACAR|nr:UBX domain-containing protein 6 [Galendromus occidentalis]
MADKIKQFFAKKKLNKQFKRAGPGHSLAEENSSSSTSPSSSSSHPQVGPTHRSQPSEQAARAGAAALARLEGMKGVDFSLSAIRAQAKKELELERQAAINKTETEKSASKTVEKPAQLGVKELLFRCPMLGPQALPRKELDEELKKFLFEQLEEERGLSAALMIVTCNKNEAAIKSCIDILSRYLTNILDHPGEEKYRKIKLSNKVFQEKVKPVIGAVEFLEAAGFAEKTLDDGEAHLCLSEEADLDMLPALKDALSTAEPLEIVLDRNPKVLLPSQSAARVSVPDEFANVTADILAKAQADRAREVDLMTQLRTKAMRERDSKQEQRSYKYTLIRIRLPNGLMLQGTFEVAEKLANVYEFLKDCLLDSCSNPVLKSGAEALTAHERTLEDLKLFPAAVVNCVVEAPPESDILRPEYLALVQDVDQAAAH